MVVSERRDVTTEVLSLKRAGTAKANQYNVLYMRLNGTALIGVLSTVATSLLHTHACHLEKSSLFVSADPPPFSWCPFLLVKPAI